MAEWAAQKPNGAARRRCRGLRPGALLRALVRALVRALGVGDLLERRLALRREAPPPEPVLVHELETETVARVRPVLVLPGRAVGGRRGALDLIRLAERDEDLAAVREPTRRP